MFGLGRRRAFDNNNTNDQNATGYQEKTVFPTDFSAPEYSNNYQSGGYAQDNGYAQNGAPQNSMVQNSGTYTQSMGGTATEVAQERPMVFASRKHNDIFIYEYSDRIEWYLKTDKEMYLFDTVKKQ